MLRRALVTAAIVLPAGCTQPEEPGEPVFTDEDGAPSDGSDPEDLAPPTTAPPTQPSRPAPTRPTSSPPPEPQPEPEKNESRPFEPEPATEFCDSLEVRSPLTADPAGLTGGWPALAIDVVVLTDQAFVEAHPNDWQLLLTDLVADASAHYEEQLGLRLRIALLDRLPDGALNESMTTDELRPVARGWMLSMHPDVAYDVVALVVGADYAGTIAGEVDCVGGAYTPDTAYLWAEYAEPRDLPADPLFEDIPLRVLMHETAHLFGAHHHYSDCGEALIELNSDNLAGVCDVMINDVGLASTRFGPVNRLVVRSFVEEHELGEPV